MTAAAALTVAPHMLMPTERPDALSLAGRVASRHGNASAPFREVRARGVDAVRCVAGLAARWEAGIAVPQARSVVFCDSAVTGVLSDRS
jgi:hypothetical protein